MLLVTLLSASCVTQFYLKNEMKRQLAKTAFGNGIVNAKCDPVLS